MGFKVTVASLHFHEDGLLSQHFHRHHSAEVHEAEHQRPKVQQHRRDLTHGGEIFARYIMMESRSKDAKRRDRI